MVITVEPGCYFNEFTLRPALKDAALAHLLVPERIEALMVRASVGIWQCLPCRSLRPGIILFCDIYVGAASHWSVHKKLLRTC